MKRILIYSTGFVLLSLYFLLTVFILPSEFLITEQLVPQPVFEATLSDTEIDLGDSFRLEIVSKNIGDYADIHIVSVDFHNLLKSKMLLKLQHTIFLFPLLTLMLVKKLVQVIVVVWRLLWQNILQLKQ